MIRLRIGRCRRLAHRAKLSLNSRCLNASHAARLTCQGVICTIPEDIGSRSTCSGMRSSLKNASHQFEWIRSGRRHSWYAFFNHILSSSQLRGDDLSSAFLYASASTDTGHILLKLTMQTLLTVGANASLKFVGPALPFLQRRPPRGPSARLIFLEQGDQGPQILG
jgi:hypothetical protein